MFRVKQATKKGYIECIDGGVADLSYPGSKLRRGRCQGDPPGSVCPALTCGVENALYRLERLDEDKDMIKIIELLNEEKCVRVQDTETGKTYRVAIRKLIPEETFILQGMEASDVDKARAMGLSDSALFKIAGNGLTTTCCQFIAESLYKTTIDKNYQTTWEKMVEKYGAAQ